MSVSLILFHGSNLLRPSGVRLVPGTLTIRIFRGEDLPQMDPGYFEGVKKFLHVGTVQKELVDPYCTVNFAGHKGRTQVIWNEQDPEWNKQINLGVRVSRLELLVTNSTCYFPSSSLAAEANQRKFDINVFYH